MNTSKTRVLILGGDGYLGWPTAMYLAQRGYHVTVADNYYRRAIAKKTDSAPLWPTSKLPQRCEEFQRITGRVIRYFEADLASETNMFRIFEETQPDTVIHYAEQPSAPYSMAGFEEARQTFQNNLNVTFNCIWAMKEIVPDAHLIKLGTMGEYGTPNIDIEEGWLDVNHNGRSEKFLYPRAASSLYHTTKVLDTDLLWFYVRTGNLRVTDLMQGPVYGIYTEETRLSEKLLTNFHYDDIFGTVVNRFLVQAVCGIPLTVYGAGGQTRGYLNLNDTMQCIQLAVQNPPKKGELKIYNQITETFTVNAIAEKVSLAAKNLSLNVQIERIENPRKEQEEHYYNPKYSALTDLGLKPTYMNEHILTEMLELISQNVENIDKSIILPRIKWKK